LLEVEYVLLVVGRKLKNFKMKLMKLKNPSIHAHSSLESRNHYMLHILLAARLASIRLNLQCLMLSNSQK